MKDFDYLGMTFVPYRQLTNIERENMFKYLGEPLPKYLLKDYNHGDFYAAAKKVDKKNGKIDLFMYTGRCVIPTGGAILYFDAPEIPEHCIREQTKMISGTAFRNLLAVIDDTGAEEFYPTPDDVAALMVEGVNWNRVNSVLEPSAGKGDLVRALRGERKCKRNYDDSEYTYYDREHLSVDCIEINPDLQAILRGKGYHVIYDDFLNFSTFKNYDLIFMNPPFSDGDRHLMKALDMQKRAGGQVICLLNAETIRNPRTNYRKELVKMLDVWDADVIYLEHAFENSERSTDVTVALIKVSVPAPVQEQSDIYERMQKASSVPEFECEQKDLAPAEFFERIVREYEVEIAAGLEIIRLYKALSPHMLSTLPELYAEQHKDDKYSYSSNEPILKLNCGKDSLNINNTYVELTRAKYWQAFLYKPEMTGKLTSELQKKYHGMVDELAQYDFNLFNIKRVAAEINAEMAQGVEDAIVKIFDQLSCKHTYNDSIDDGNVHYYNGWKTNKAYKINNKVIIPSYGIFPDYSWAKDTFHVYEAYSHLADIEKCFNFLDGHMTTEVNLHLALERANSVGKTRNIQCKFFDVTFYKKGTTHIKFTNLELLEKFNIYASRKRGWLPPNYGRTKYDDLNTEERTVIDEFQGRDQYEKVVSATGYYLVESLSMVALPEAI